MLWLHVRLLLGSEQRPMPVDSLGLCLNGWVLLALFLPVKLQNWFICTCITTKLNFVRLRKFGVSWSCWDRGSDGC